ncbi:hypothetical protein M514_25769 [Trichuris suis]|uniref:HTH CENPB-type domain-containing protein n=1 Tax=Trichuris suis TaxID=68888 RepID=A0A085MXV4_9BILA|nr:hypothetical protein M514_25769 [Trichuris suis]
MEELLVIRMESQIQKNVPLSLLTIQAKATSLFNTLKQRFADPTHVQMFRTSREWFQLFKRRHNFHNVKVSGETTCADIESSVPFDDEFDRIIADEKYLPEQIFNFDETSLFWKRMPERTYIQQQHKRMPGHRVNKDRVTLLLVGNVAGFKLKPFLINHSGNRRPLRNVNKDRLPVYYRHNKKA